ncbi:hypothetical protein GWK47_003060 [Chionoecetes opilio]|uniref:Uncharacterized protein n=1 Tax=Chionoecetes opilio TaxID=41210 RepID=A0A8J8WEP4_CHIOP|nr:hypothetical protein GWK47_003060 [Chionoecetes opilio]
MLMILNPKDDERDKEEKKENPSSNLLAGVRLRSTGLADSLMSPTNGFPRGSGGNKSPNCNRDSCIDTSGPSPSTKPVITALKPKPPPPLAPKPRPKSVSGGDRRSGVAPELLVLLDKRRSTLTTNQLEVYPCMTFVAQS